MRCYYVVTDNNASQKDRAQRDELKMRLAVSDLEDNAPNRQIQFGKVDRTGARWFGGIDLDSKALTALNKRDASGRAVQQKLTALLESEIRAALPAGERANLSVQVVAFNADILIASQQAQAWLAANWSYPDDKPDRGGDIRPGRS